MLSSWDNLILSVKWLCNLTTTVVSSTGSFWKDSVPCFSNRLKDQFTLKKNMKLNKKKCVCDPAEGHVSIKNKQKITLQNNQNIMWLRKYAILQTTKKSLAIYKTYTKRELLLETWGFTSAIQIFKTAFHCTLWIMYSGFYWELWYSLMSAGRMILLALNGRSLMDGTNSYQQFVPFPVSQWLCSSKNLIVFSLQKPPIIDRFIAG